MLWYSDKLPLLGGVKKTFEKVHSYTAANLARKELKDALAVPGKGERNTRLCY